MPTVRSICRSTSSPSSRLSHGCATRARSSSDHGHRSRLVTTRRARTTSSRPAGWGAGPAAARYGMPLDEIVRFDLTTSPPPPALVDQLLANGRFDAPVSEYPPSDYRRLVGAAAARYGVEPAEILVGAGADEILDLVAKAFL